MPKNEIQIYHGTAASFSAFDEKHIKRTAYGRGFYFTEDKDVAASFAGTGDARIKARGINESAFLDIRDGRITKETVQLIAKKLGKSRIIAAIEYARLNPRLHKNYGGLEAVFEPGFADTLAKKMGKVGIIASAIDGTAKNDVYVVQNTKYLNDYKYREQVNKLGGDPAYIRKITKARGRVVHTDKMVDDMARRNKIMKRSGDLRKGYLEGVRQLKKKAPIDVTKMQKSLTQIQSGKRPDYQTPEWSIKTGLRLAALDSEDKKTNGLFCRMLGTDADEPDFEHSLLEGEVLPCSEVIEHCRRFGCRHDFEVINE